MYNISKYTKMLLSFTVLTLILFIFAGCSSNQELKATTEQVQSNTEVQEETSEVIEKPLPDWEVQEMNNFNDFQGVLIDIASTHPGTAGCSLQTLNNAKDLLNFCKAKLPFDVMAKSWAENLYDSEVADTHESFVFQLETLERLSKGNDKKEFDENDIENDAPYDKEIYNIAISAVKTVIDCTK